MIYPLKTEGMAIPGDTQLELTSVKDLRATRSAFCALRRDGSVDARSRIGKSLEVSGDRYHLYMKNTWYIYMIIYIYVCNSMYSWLLFDDICI